MSALAADGSDEPAGAANDVPAAAMLQAHSSGSALGISHSSAQVRHSRLSCSRPVARAHRRYWLRPWLRCPRRGGASAPGHLCPLRHSQLSQAVKPLRFGRTLTQYTIGSNPHCPASGQQSGADSESPTGRLAVPRPTRTAINLPSRSPWPAPLSCTGSQSQAQASFMCAAPVARAAAASTKHSPGGGSQASGSVVTAAAWATARLQASESQRRSSAKSSRPALARATVNAAAVAGASHSPTPRTLQRLALAGASHSQ